MISTPGHRLWQSMLKCGTFQRRHCMHLFYSNVLSCQTFWFARHMRVQMKVHMGTQCVLHILTGVRPLLTLTVWGIWEAFLIPPCPSDPTEISAPRPPGGNYSGPKTPNGPKVKIVKILTLLFLLHIKTPLWAKWPSGSDEVLWLYQCMWLVQIWSKTSLWDVTDAGGTSGNQARDLLLAVRQNIQWRHST